MFTPEDRLLLEGLVIGLRELHGDVRHLRHEGHEMKESTTKLIAVVGTLVTAVGDIGTGQNTAVAEIRKLADIIKDSSDDPVVLEQVAKIADQAAILEAGAKALADAAAAAEGGVQTGTAPVIASISPASPVGAAGPQVVVLSGSKFGATPTVRFTLPDGTAVDGAVQEGSDTEISVEVDFAGQTSKAGVSVTDPATGLASEAFTFILG